MKKNKLLRIALISCNFFTTFFIITFILLLFMAIHWHFNPAFYSIVETQPANTGAINFSFISADDQDTELAFYLGTRTLSYAAIVTSLADFNLLAFIVFVIQTGTFLIFMILILRELKKIITSVKNISTFRSTNTHSFYKIGKYCLLLLLIMGFTYLESERGVYIAFALHLTPAIFALISFILAEIFYEGSKLSEENQLTI